jgi:hypothetical protein
MKPGTIMDDWSKPKRPVQSFTVPRVFKIVFISPANEPGAFPRPNKPVFLSYGTDYAGDHLRFQPQTGEPPRILHHFPTFFEFFPATERRIAIFT